MKKISKIFKIIVAVIMAMTLIRISTVKAENGIVTVNENSSVVITNVSGEIVEITVDMFDLSSTDWVCIHDSQGMVGYLYLDESFDRIPLNNLGDKLICSPISGEAFFDASLLGDNVEVTYDGNKPSIGYHEIRYFDEYVITNNEEVDISLFWLGEYNINYIHMLPDGMSYETTSENGWLQVLRPGETLTFTVIDEGSYNITNPYVGCFWYSTGNFNNVDVDRDISDDYTSKVTEKTCDLDGTIYTVTNNGEYMEIISNGTTEYEGIIYDSNGIRTGTVSNANAIGTDIKNYIPAGGKIVYTSGATTNGELTISYYSMYDPVVEFSGLRKAAPAEDKKIYIHFPEGPLVPEGLSEDDKGYYISTEVTYVDTTLDQEKDTVGGFSIPAIKDTTGMAVVDRWYVYNSETGTYYDTAAETGDTLTVKPLTTGIYSQLLDTYGDSSEYHLYVEWDISEITQSGIYNLIKDVEYTFGSGTWTVEGDSGVYSGDMSFYVDDAAGNYQLTLQ